MDAVVELDSGMRFIGKADSGFAVAMDSVVSVGGADSGFRPMELILVGLCGCTAMDVISILRKKRQLVTSLQVKAHAEQAKDHPHVFTSIALEYIVTGMNVDPNAVERSIELSTERYCPATAMLGKVADVTTHYTINEES